MQVYDVIIIGGGPGGIGSAVEANIMGMEKILLIEKSDNHSDTIRKFYKDNKRVDKDWKGQQIELEGNVQFFDGTKETTINYFDTLLDEQKIDTQFNCEVEAVEKKEGVFHVQTKQGEFYASNVIVAIGRMGKPNKPSYKIPPSIKSLVNFNIDKCSANDKILVVGGGDSALEYACELSFDNTVTLNYRKSEFTRANPTNVENILRFNGEERLRLRLGTDILSLENEQGKVKVNYDDGYATVYDRVVYAIGGTTPVGFLQSCGIELDENGEPIFDDNYETPIGGLFVAGDIAFNSGGSIAIALNHGYRIVTTILERKKS